MYQCLKNQLNVVIVKNGFKIKKMPVCDHCHFTVQFRGAAHIECNPQHQIKKSSYQFNFNNIFGVEGDNLLINFTIQSGLFSSTICMGMT